MHIKVRWLAVKSRVPFQCPDITVLPPQDAYEQVLLFAGCYFPVRDAVDTRIANDVKDGTGKIIDDPAEVGGWPTLKNSFAPQDSDNDGMPDAWELRNKLNPHDYSDANNITRIADEFTNLEIYYNDLPLQK